MNECVGDFAKRVTTLISLTDFVEGGKWSCHQAPQVELSSDWEGGRVCDGLEW